MKKLLLLLSIVLAVLSLENADGQISLSHAYPGASKNFFMANLEIAGDKYCWQDWAGSRVILYNLDHSVFKIMHLPNVPFGNYLRTIQYVSQNLFDCSEERIEYLYEYYDMELNGYNVVIADELGNILFSSGGYSGKMCVPWGPIYNTSAGTKMILNGWTNLEARVYDLCGTLTTAMQPMALTQDNSLLSAFPNPTRGHVTLEYELPPGIQNGEIVLYNIHGVELKRYMVDNTFSNLLLDNSSLSTGTYFYELVGGGTVIGTKKMILIN